MLAAKDDCGIGKAATDQIDQSNYSRPFVCEHDSDADDVGGRWNPFNDLFEP